MRILVLSDTHGNIDKCYLERIKKDNKFDMLIHCGDCCKDLKYISDETGISKYVNVCGNCDFENAANEVEKITLEDKNILVTHGHMFGVKRDIEKLKSYAENEKADIVLFGHTHRPFSQYYNNILYFNPGSACIPTYGGCTYGVITIDDNGQVFDEIIEC